MPDRLLPKWTEFKKRTGTSTRMQWQTENDQRLKYERANPQHYGTDGSTDYRTNFDAIDWSDDGKER